MNVDISYLDYQQSVFFDWPEHLRYKIIPKGRRAGITKGAANAVIEWLIEKGGPVLWGETTHGNIERYYERYFKPVLSENNIPHRFDKQSKQLTIGNQYCDFRSADNPENWEGFGYKKIFLNEAGIILKNRTLYTGSVLPMMLDYPESKLIAAGVPKGKILRDGTEHAFYTLAKKAGEGKRQYELRTFSTYDNPLLSATDIAELEEEIGMFSPDQIQQEIYGVFIEMDAMNPFADQFIESVHTCPRRPFDPQKQLYIKIDFNLTPFGVTFGHLWRDNRIHYHTIDEAEIRHGSIPAMIDLIKQRYEPQLPSCRLTGDNLGTRGDISQRDNASNFQQLQRGLGLRDSQVQVIANPSHKNSRTDVNYVLFHSSKEDSYFDFKIYDNCVNTIRDFKSVQCDAFGEILKRNRNDINQRADFLDCERYGINVWLKPFILEHQKRRK